MTDSPKLPSQHSTVAESPTPITVPESSAKEDAAPIPPHHDPELPLIQHLVELRNRLVRSLIVILVLFLGLYAFSNELYLLLSEPLRNVLPESGNLIATGVTAPFLVPFKLTLVTSIFLAVPYLLHQVWGFIAPALYQHEKKFAVPLLATSIALFYSGVLFAYFVVLPLVFGFFANAGPVEISIMPDISNVLNFALKLFIAFGVAFEIPIATYLLVMAGITTTESLIAKRPYIIVGCFVVGMLITPPDVISQTILAVPMWLLFEIGVLFAKNIPKKEESEEA